MRRILTVLVIATIGLAACGQAPAPITSPVRTTTVVSTDAPAATDGPTATSAPTAAAAALPTQDFSSYLLTQAYSAFTPQPGATEIVVTPTATATRAAGGSAASGGRATTAPATALPAGLYVAEPIQIPKAVNSAACTIRNQGDCTKTMPAGVTVDFVFTFGYSANQTFSWGDAAISVSRDNKQIAWSQVGNMFSKPPDFTKNESWSIKVGQTAQFAYGMEKLQPGHYTARLAMCTATPQECSAGQGWQNVGGDAIDFVITP
jgi:hypothetical protein